MDVIFNNKENKNFNLMGNDCSVNHMRLQPIESIYVEGKGESRDVIILNIANLNYKQAINNIVLHGIKKSAFLPYKISATAKWKESQVKG